MQNSRKDAGFKKETHYFDILGCYGSSRIKFNHQ
jgi:hypothetical protein